MIYKEKLAGGGNKDKQQQLSEKEGCVNAEQAFDINRFGSLLDFECAPNTSRSRRSSLFYSVHTARQSRACKVVSYSGVQCNLSNSCADEFALRDFQKSCGRVLRHCSARKHSNSTRFLYRKNRSASRRSHQRSISGVSEFKYTFRWGRELASNAAFFKEVA